MITVDTYNLLNYKRGSTPFIDRYSHTADGPPVASSLSTVNSPTPISFKNHRCLISSLTQIMDVLKCINKARLYMLGGGGGGDLFFLY